MRAPTARSLFAIWPLTKKRLPSRAAASAGCSHSSSIGVSVRGKHCGDEDIARRLQAAIAAQTHAATKSFGKQRLLRFGKAKFPGIAGVLDARERRCAGSAAMASDDDVIGKGLGDAG